MREELRNLCDGVLGEGARLPAAMADAERLLETVRAFREAAYTEPNADRRREMLARAEECEGTVATYAEKANDTYVGKARESADRMLAMTQKFASEDELSLTRSLLPEVKRMRDRLNAIAAVLPILCREIADADGTGRYRTQIFIFGASSTTDRYPAEKHFPWQGWGYAFDAYFDDSVAVHNVARNGWGLKSLTGSLVQNRIDPDTLFNAENNVWRQMLMRLYPGDYVFFGSTSGNELWQRGGDVFYIEGRDGMRYLVGQGTEGAVSYTVRTSVEEYGERLAACCRELVALGVTPIVCSTVGNFAMDDEEDESGYRFRNRGTGEYEKIKARLVRYLNEELGERRVYFADPVPLIYERFRQDMDEHGDGFDELLTRYFRTQRGIEEYYARYGFVGAELTSYLTGDTAYVADRVHQNIRGALLSSSSILKSLRGSGLPLLRACRTYELDETETVVRTLRALGVPFVDPRGRSM